MVEPMMIDLKALMVEREDCDAGTVQQLRNGLAQGGNQYRTLRDVTEVLRKKLEAASGPAAKKWHLKLGIALFFLGHTHEAAEQLRQAEGALAGFYLGRALASQQEFDDALKALCPVPVGWQPEPLKVNARRAHERWVSPTGRTAYGVIHFKLPWPVGPDLALKGFRKFYETVISASKKTK